MQISLTRLLKDRGIRLTRARTALLEVLSDAKAPRSIPDILAVLQQSGKVFNKTTLYRELECLGEHGIVRSVLISGDKRYYELAGEHHHHCICLGCGEIRDVVVQDTEEVRVFERELRRRSGFIVHEHSMEFFGMCRACQV